MAQLLGFGITSYTSAAPAPSWDMMNRDALSATSYTSSAPAPSWDMVDRDALQARLQAIADSKAAQYECEISIAVETGSGLSVSASTVGGAFVWGSVTKLATGAALMQMVGFGKLTLDGPVAPHIDGALANLGLGSLASLFGAAAGRVTLRHLLGMKSGIPDYDTAKPFPLPPTDPFRASVYAHPSDEYPPEVLLNLTWVRRGALDFPPGERFSYSSTNFVLAGLLLASLKGARRWDEYDQKDLLSPLPLHRRRQYAGLRFATHGTPASVGAVRGYDRTNYNGANHSARPGRKVGSVAGVFGGWTASDLVAPASDVARLAYDLFGASGPRLLAPELVAEMVPGASRQGSAAVPPSPEMPPAIYGLATFNLSMMGLTGQSPLGPYARAYGHLGATYGYDSIVGYFPGIDVAISVASSIETDVQTQPSDALCFAYNAVLAAARGLPEPACSFSKHSYFGGSCNCGNDYVCRAGMCIRDALGGSLYKEDCSRVCA